MKQLTSSLFVKGKKMETALKNLFVLMYQYILLIHSLIFLMKLLTCNNMSNKTRVISHRASTSENTPSGLPLLNVPLSWAK